MKRRSFIKTAAASTAGAAVLPGLLYPENSVAKNRPGDKEKPTERPNILWVMSEDISPDLGCYGDPVAETPNVDAFAKQGVRYTNAYTTCSICSPSRSAMITGMYQTSIGAHNHRTLTKHAPSLPDPVVPITEMLRKAGYYTVNDNPNPSGSKNKKMGHRGSGKTDFNFAYEGEVFEGTDWRDRKEGQPFFAQLTLMTTHRGPGWKEARKMEDRITPEEVNIPPYYPDHPVARQDFADYYNGLKLMDKYFGELLQRLEDEGIADNTVVFFLGDEGRAMLRAKQWLYNSGLHIPLIIRWPGHIEPATVCDDMVSGIDLSATALYLAGLEVPDWMEGRAFMDPSVPRRDFIVGARDRADATVDRVRSIHTKHFNYIKNFYPERPYTQQNRYKDTRYPMLQLLKDLHKEDKLTETQLHFMAPEKPEEELYDLLADPHEIHNLAEDPAYRGILEEQRARLDNWIEETGDKGAIPESQEILDEIEKKRIEKYGF